jgi:hypothetical protein
LATTVSGAFVAASFVGALQATVKMDKAMHVAMNEKKLFNCMVKICFEQLTTLND